MEFKQSTEWREIIRFIKKSNFMKCGGGLDSLAVQAHLEDLAILYEKSISVFLQALQKQKEAFYAKTQGSFHTGEYAEGAVKAVCEQDSVFDISKQKKGHTKTEEAQTQQNSYTEKTNLLRTLLQEQEAMLQAAKLRADAIIAQAQKEANALQNALPDSAVLRVKKEAQMQQSITQRSKAVQNLLQGLREQVQQLAKDIDALQARAGELKTLRALREQVQELARGLDALQMRSEEAEGLVPLAPQQSEASIKSVSAASLNRDTNEEEEALSEREKLYLAARRARAAEIERQQAVLDALLAKQAQEEARA